MSAKSSTISKLDQDMLAELLAYGWNQALLADGRWVKVFQANPNTALVKDEQFEYVGYGYIVDMRMESVEVAADV